MAHQALEESVWRLVSDIGMQAAPVILNEPVPQKSRGPGFVTMWTVFT